MPIGHHHTAKGAPSRRDHVPRRSRVTGHITRAAALWHQPPGNNPLQ
jgi:hypothetical protein